MEEVMYQELKSEKIKERMHNGLLEVGYTEKQIKKYLANGLTEEEYERLIEVHTEKTSTDKEGYVKFTYVNHSERADKFGRISDGNTTKYMNIALKYFSDRCALSGEKFEGFEKVKNSKVKSNLSAEHIVALCQGGDDVYPNLVPTVLQYNVSKNGYYLLDWWNKQKDTAGNNLYSSYRLLKLVNFMMKSLDARKQNLSLKQYENAILTYNEIDEFLAEIEKQDSQETDNSKRKLISDIKTTTEVDEDGKKFLQTIPEIEGDIPKQSEQQRKKNDDKMMDIFLYDSIKMLKEDEKLSQHTEFNQLMDCLDKMFIKARDVIPFEVKVRNKILNKIEELGVKENKYTVANALLQNTEILNIVKENSYEIDKYISQHFEEKEKQLIEKLGLTDKQIQIAVANIPEILYDESVIKKVYFYKENRLDHLQDYLEGKNNVTDKFIDNFIMLQSIGVDTNKLVVSDSIESLAKKSGISVEQLIEVGLNPSENIGTNKNSIIQAYRGKGNITPPTKEQAEELGNLGISLEERDVTQEFIDKINKLQSMGVDTNKLVQSDTIESLAKKSGISVEQLIEVGLNPSENIGTNKNSIIQAYRGKGNITPPTKEQAEELKNLRISLEERDVTQEFIDKIKKLQSIGADTNKLVKSDTIESLAKKSGISVEQLIEVGLNPSENIGTSKNNIAKAYRGNSKRVPPTKEQAEELENLGISLEKKVTREKIKTVISEQKQAGKIEENSKIDETFNENFRNAESSKIKEHGVR